MDCSSLPRAQGKESKHQQEEEYTWNKIAWNEPTPQSVMQEMIPL
ncbi:MAG TPA: hypothetical protein V6C97_03335 [Oculatellaceae cyanobacterium]